MCLEEKFDPFSRYYLVITLLPEFGLILISDSNMVTTVYFIYTCHVSFFECCNFEFNNI